MTEEEYLEKYRVTEYRIVYHHEDALHYRVEFFEPLINHWQCWGEYLTLREAKRFLRSKRRDERRWVEMVKRNGMKGLHDAWAEIPVVYYYKEKK